MLLTIVPRPDFRSVQSVPEKFNRYDPRADSFRATEVVINLGECVNVHSPAIMWCAVYLLLAKSRGSGCRLITPKNAALSSYLADTGLIPLLREAGIDVDIPWVTPSISSEIVLPLTRFRNLTEAEDLTNQIHYSLNESRRGAVSIYDVVYETFSELANNAAEHSESSIGAYGFVQFYSSQKKNRFVCGVADGGIGVQRSLSRNPEHREYGGYAWTAMERAVGELVSGTLSGYRGIGLFETVEKMRKIGRQLIIHSGDGIITKSGKLTTRITSTRLFPGTMAYISIPT